jgi:hypothetical protein
MPNDPANARLSLAARAVMELRARRGGAGLWSPIPESPQVEALASLADELYYGGAAGGGKTDLLIGVALTQHRKAVIFRRTYPELDDAQERLLEIVAGQGQFNRSSRSWAAQGGRRITFGAIQLDRDKDKWRGRAHDLKAFDEVGTFTESMYLFLSGWNRSTYPGQRCRIIAAGYMAVRSLAQEGQIQQS